VTNIAVINDVWEGDWETLGTGQDTKYIKWLWRDGESDSYAALIKFPEGWKGHLTTPARCARTWYVLEGGWEMQDGTQYEKGAFYHGPPGTDHGAVVTSPQGCIVISMMNAPA